jgi:hypothetical protein
MTARSPTPKKMSKAVPRLTVGLTPNVQPGVDLTNDFGRNIHKIVFMKFGSKKY